MSDIVGICPKCEASMTTNSPWVCEGCGKCLNKMPRRYEVEKVEFNEPSDEPSSAFRSISSDREREMDYEDRS